MKTLLINKKQKHFLSVIMIFLASCTMVSIFVLRGDGRVFLRKTKLSYANFIEKNISVKNQSKKLEPISVWAAYPPSVNSLPTCPFTNGNIGDIFAKNSGCSWSDYKCTLTNYNRCDSSSYGNTSPSGDYCWCSYDTNRVCGIQQSNSFIGCWSNDGTKDYSEYCDLCVRR